MKKSQLVSALGSYAKLKRGRSKGANTLAQFLASWFNKLYIPADEKYDWWQIDPNLPQLLLAACDDFRTSQEAWVVELRTAYEQELEQPFPELTKVGTGDGINPLLTISVIGHLIEEVTGNVWMRSRVEGLLNAERLLGEQYFYRFIHQVYQQGMADHIAANLQGPVMSGEFGETTLNSYGALGATVFIFARPGEERLMDSVTFVCQEGDPLGLGGGLQSCCADLTTVVAMIDDVITGWPKDRGEQFLRFTASSSASL